jgi:hypothetical protein
VSLPPERIHDQGLGIVWLADGGQSITQLEFISCVLSFQSVSFSEKLDGLLVFPLLQQAGSTLVSRLCFAGEFACFRSRRKPVK